MRRVFVLEPCKQNVSEANTFGEIIYLFEYDGDRSSIWSSTFNDELSDALDRWRFDPQKDLFVVAGQMVPLAMALAMLGAKFGQFEALLYNSSDRQYVLRNIGDSHEN